MSLRDIALASSILTSLGGTGSAMYFCTDEVNSNARQAVAQADLNELCRLPSNDMDPPCFPGSKADVNKTLDTISAAQEEGASARWKAIAGGVTGGIGAASALTLLARRRRKEEDPSAKR